MKTFKFCVMLVCFLVLTDNVYARCLPWKPSTCVPHRAPEATSNHYMMEKTQEDINRERREARMKKQKKQAERAAQQRKQVYREREEYARRVKEEERMYQEHRAQEQRQENERVNRAQRAQEQNALRNIDRGRNYTSQPTKNEEIMRAEDNFARALRNVRGQ